MQFKPKIVDNSERWDDETTELQLPDDLAELGAQLHDDAMHLARVHPAWPETSCAPQVVASGGARRVRMRRARGLLGFSVSAAAILLVAAFAAYRVPEAPAPETAGENVTRSVDDSNPARPSWFSLSTNEWPAGSPSIGWGAPDVTPRTSTLIPEEAGLLQTGGPQAEAYLDYIEMTTVRNVKLSL